LWNLERLRIMGSHRNRTPRQIAAKLRSDGWFVKRKDPGDHVKYAHPQKPGKVTLDMGANPIPTGTLRSIYRQAGWKW
jgi:predicted RNA binding protein YcfA (HicA-like mRNA interferase family)